LLILQATALAYFIATAFKGVTKVHLFKTASFDNAFSSSQRSTVAFLLPIVIAGAVVLLGVYGVGRAYAASYYFFRSSYALQQNDAANTYEMQRRAAEMNPYMSVYRSNYALTNLAIATALANKQDITEQERNEVAQLVQQAIREARAATILRPEDTQNWRVLAQVYRNLIGSAEGADQWAVSSYVEAITTNPSDPTLRIELGGIFLNEQQFNDAILLFQQAAELKPDYANAYYNLANALKSANQLASAEAAYKQTLVLIPADSEDYVRVNQELEELQAALAQQQESAQQAGEGQEGTNAQDANAQSSNPASSLLNQNVSQTDAEVVTQPSNQPLTTTPDAVGTQPADGTQPTQ
jgi:tetratricopeptide (TPR) repeat protein